MTQGSVNEILICVAFLIWGFLILKIIISLTKKAYCDLKKDLLYLFNSLIFFVGWVFYVGLAIITQGLKEKTEEASFILLRRRCTIELTHYLIISILITIGFTGFNILYQKYFFRKGNIEKRMLVLLAIGDLLILIILSCVAVLDYYLGIGDQINRYYH